MASCKIRQLIPLLGGTHIPTYIIMHVRKYLYNLIPCVGNIFFLTILSSSPSHPYFGTVTHIHTLSAGRCLPRPIRRLTQADVVPVDGVRFNNHFIIYVKTIPPFVRDHNNIYMLFIFPLPETQYY